MAKLELVREAASPVTLKYLASAVGPLRRSYKRIAVPWAGAFNAILAVNQAGFRAAEIWASDPSLYANVVGSLAAKRGLELLEVKFAGECAWLEEYRGGSLFAGAILWALTWARLSLKEGAYYAQLKQELDGNRVDYIKRLQSQTVGPVTQLAGLKWAAPLPDEAPVLTYAAPRKEKEPLIERWLTWKRPEVVPSGDGLILTFMQGSKQAKVTAEVKEQTVFVAETTRGIERITASRPEELKFRLAQGRKVTDLAAASYPLLPYDYELTPKAKITFVRATKEVALYYRDLFAHKLGVTRAEVYFLGLIDGYLFSVCGFFLSDAARRRYTRGREVVAIQEQFGFCVPTQYYRINKLMMMCLTTRQFLRLLIEGMPVMLLLDGVEFQTTCLADVPELKSNRGILKIVSRSMLPNGKFKLVYVSPFRDEGYADCLLRWLSKDGKVLSERARPALV